MREEARDTDHKLFWPSQPRNQRTLSEWSIFRTPDGRTGCSCASSDSSHTPRNWPWPATQTSPRTVYSASPSRAPPMVEETGRQGRRGLRGSCGTVGRTPPPAGQIEWPRRSGRQTLRPKEKDGEEVETLEARRLQERARGGEKGERLTQASTSLSSARSDGPGEGQREGAVTESSTPCQCSLSSFRRLSLAVSRRRAPCPPHPSCRSQAAGQPFP